MRCIFIIFLIKCSLLSLSAQEAPRHSLSSEQFVQQAESAYQLAQKFRKSSNYDSSNYYLQQAAKKYQNAKKYSKYWDMMNDLAYNYTSEGKHDQARQILNRSLKMNARYAKGKNKAIADTYYTLAITYFREKDYDAEIAYLDTTLMIQQELYKKNRSSHPDIATTKNTMGIAYSHKKEYNIALRYFLEAKEIRANNFHKNHPSLANSYRNIGNIYKKLGQYDNALDYFKKEFKVTQAMTKGMPHQVWTRSYRNIAEIYFLKERHKEALKYFKKSEKINRNLHGISSIEVSVDYNNLGAVYSRMGKFDLAIQYFNKSLKIKQKKLGHEASELAQVYNNLGVAYSGKTQLPEALKYHEKALEIRKKNFGESHPQTAISYNNLGEVFDLKGDYDEALIYFLKSLNIRENYHQDLSLETALAYSNVGSIYSHKGEYQKALTYHLKSLEIREKTFKGKHPDIATSYNNIGVAYYQKRNYEKALEYFEKTLKMRQELLGKQHPDIAIAYNNMGVAEYLKKNHLKALDYYTKALEIKRITLGATHPALAQTYSNIGTTYFEMGEYQQALEFYRQALNLQRNHLGDKHPFVAGAYNNLGGNYFRIGNYEKALENYHLSLLANTPEFENQNSESFPSVSEFMDERRSLYALLGKTECFLKMHEEESSENQLKIAYEHLLLADKLIDKTRNLYTNESDKILLAEIVHRMTDLALQTCQQLYIYTLDRSYLHRTFYFVEKSKSVVLLASIAAKNFDELPSELVRQEQELLKKISLGESQLIEDKASTEKVNAEKLDLTRQKIFELRREYEILIQEFAKKYPKYYELKYDVNIRSTKELQSEILRKQPRTALVEYFIGRDDRIYICVLTAKKYEMLILNGADGLENAIRGLRNGIKYKVNKVFVSYSSELYQTLMQPVVNYFHKNRLKVNKLIIVNDGLTAYLPFETLLTQPTEGSDMNYKKFPYLAKDYTISYTFSATLMANKFHQKQFGDSTYIAFAPIFEKKNTKIVPEQGRSELPSWSNTVLDGQRIAPLPATKTETEGIQRLYKKKRMTTQNMLEQDASERQVKNRNLENYRFIHFATHGFMNEMNPQLSGLLLAQNPNQTEDGILYAGEIYNLRLKADLVMLSACQTGLGKIVRGEGIIGLTRGFLYAGAKNVGVSMWKVADESTSGLMINFYKYLLKGKSKPEALQKAKQKLMKSKQYQHPYYWGAFVLIGAE